MLFSLLQQRADDVELVAHALNALSFFALYIDVTLLPEVVRLLGYGGGRAPAARL